MKITDQPKDFRPREKLSRMGSENLSIEELIAIIISTGTRGKNAIEISKELIKVFGDRILSVSVEEISTIKGLGKVKAIKLKAAFEIGLRYANIISGKIIINTTKDSYSLLHEYAFKRQEHFLLLTLNSRNQLLQKRVITVGTIDSSLFHPREIFAEAILDRASKIIVAHNHPSGNLEPSNNDIMMTSRIRDAGIIIGIDLVDSVIISEEGYNSIINYSNAKNI